MGSENFGVGCRGKNFNLWAEPSVWGGGCISKLSSYPTVNTVRLCYDTANGVLHVVHGLYPGILYYTDFQDTHKKLYRIICIPNFMQTGQEMREVLTKTNLRPLS
jgi:hypothetical protein